jgi:transcriptional regulator with XRE-family HTH domain
MKMHGLWKSSILVEKLHFYGPKPLYDFVFEKIEIRQTIFTKWKMFAEIIITMNKYPNIKSLRLQNNYKQEYVADILGISQPEYSKIEGGMRRIDAFMITELCKLYDVKMDELLRRDVIRPNHAMASDSMGAAAYGQMPGTDLLVRLMDNYTVLLDNYVKQQQTTERIINRLFEQQRA